MKRSIFFAGLFALFVMVGFFVRGNFQVMTWEPEARFCLAVIPFVAAWIFSCFPDLD